MPANRYAVQQGPAFRGIKSRNGGLNPFRCFGFRVLPFQTLTRTINRLPKSEFSSLTVRETSRDTI